MWRPKDWNANRIVAITLGKYTGYSNSINLVEAGADAMLESLKASGDYGKKFDGNIPYHIQTPTKGWSVFIPDIP